MKIRTGNHLHSHMSRSGIKNFLNILKSLIMTLYGQRNIRRVAYRLNQFDDKFLTDIIGFFNQKNTVRSHVIHLQDIFRSHIPVF